MNVKQQAKQQVKPLKDPLRAGDVYCQWGRSLAVLDIDVYCVLDPFCYK